MRSPWWFSAIYHIKLSYTYVWKSDLDQLRSWSKSFLQTCVLRFYRLWKKMAHMTFETSIANFLNYFFFRFNMFIWRSIMSYVNAVLIKISVLNSTMTTAFTSKFQFSFYLFTITTRHLWASDVVKCVFYKIKSFQNRLLYCNFITEIMFAFCSCSTYICTKLNSVNSTFGTYFSLFPQ